MVLDHQKPLRNEENNLRAQFQVLVPVHLQLGHINFYESYPSEKSLFT